MERTRLFVDMDGTLAVFNNQIESEEALFQQGYFRDLPPHQKVIAAVKELIKHPDLEVFVLSAVLPSQYAQPEKEAWLDKYLPEINRAHRIFVPCGENKSAYIGHALNEKDLLLDDYSVNLHSWCPPGRAVKLMNGINGHFGTWIGEKISHIDSPKKITQAILEVAHLADLNYPEGQHQESDFSTLYPPQLPGWQVIQYDDGSGHFITPEGKSMYSFDKSTGEYQDEQERWTDFYDDPGPPSNGDSGLVGKIIRRIVDFESRQHTIGNSLVTMYQESLGKATAPDAVIETVCGYACALHSVNKRYIEEDLVLGELDTLCDHPAMQGLTREKIEYLMCDWLRQKGIPLPNIENKVKQYERDTIIAAGSLINQFDDYKEKLAAEMAKVDQLAEEELKDFHNTIKGFIATDEKQLARLDRRFFYRLFHKKEYEEERKDLTVDIQQVKQQLMYTVDDIKRDIMPNAYAEARESIQRPTVLGYVSADKPWPVSTRAEAEAITKLKLNFVLNADNAAQYQRHCKYLGKEPIDTSFLVSYQAKEVTRTTKEHYRQLCRQQNAKQTNKKEKSAEQEV